MTVRPSLACLALALCACSGDGGKGSFTLTLSPLFLDGQDVLGGGPDVELVVRRPDAAEPEVHYVGEASAGASLELPDIEPLTAGTSIGLLLEEAGGAQGEWDPEATVAWGQTLLTEAPGAETAVEVLVPRFGEVGELGTLPAAKQRMSPASALLPSGDVFTFGGSEPAQVGVSECSDRIFAMRGTDSGGTEFEQLSVKLPQTSALGANNLEEEFSARCGATATPVNVGGEDLVLVAGGRRRWSDSSANTSQWLLFDPIEEAIVEKGLLGGGHSGHLAIPFTGGKILIYGGLGSSGFPQWPSFDIWNPETASNKAGDTQYDASGILAFGSPLGADAVVCGGVTVFITAVPETNGIWDWSPDDTCKRISASGDVEVFDPLPVPLAGAAMAELPNGDLLVTGGFAQPTRDDFTVNPPTFSSSPASGTMYRHRDGAGWTEVGALRTPRVAHQMLPLSDGRVLIVGGTTSATALFGAVSGAVRCAEIYDPTGDGVRELGCSDAGAGAFPVVGALAGEGAFVLEGYTVDDNLAVSGISAYGMISTGPSLSP